MRRWLRITLILLVVLIVVLLGLVVAALGWRTTTRVLLGPEARPLTARRFDPTPERLERGRYLVTAVAGCLDCHSPFDYNDPQGSHPVPGQEGAGQRFPLEGLPGAVYAPNLTSDPDTGIGRVSDDALARAIREGVGHDGRALFNLMPYPKFHSMSDEDLASVIVYLRTLPPVRNAVPHSRLVFPVSRLIQADPRPLNASVAPPNLSDPVKRGSYLVTLADCETCHTPADEHGQPLPGLAFGGGFHLKGPWGDVFGANITPDPSGISYYDEARFLEVIRTGHVGVRPLNPIMPWSSFRHMTDDDLRAIFAYLKTLKPVAHKIDNTEPPTFCKLCRQTHGFGDRN